LRFGISLLAHIVRLRTDNSNFFGGKTRGQEPLWTAQTHAGYNFRPGLWLAADITHYFGGDTILNGVNNQDFQSVTRYGAPLWGDRCSCPKAVLPAPKIARLRSVKTASQHQTAVKEAARGVIRLQVSELQVSELQVSEPQAEIDAFHEQLSERRDWLNALKPCVAQRPWPVPWPAAAASAARR
jgi:hypothetical protein